MQICHQVSHGIQALFGPNDFILGSHVQSLCDALDIPHLEARPDIDNSYKESSLNLHPSQDLMNQAYKVKINMRRVQQKPSLQELTNFNYG